MPYAIKKAEDVMSTMLAKGFVLGKNVLQHAKSLDERHHLTSTASATASSLDRKIGLTEKITIGTSVVNSKVREVDERFQVSQITRSAIATAEQKATTAGSAILNNPYVSTGVSWLSTAVNKVVNVATDVGSLTKEKVEKAEEEKEEIISRERKEMLDEFAKLHLDESYGERVPAASAGYAPLGDDDGRKL